MRRAEEHEAGSRRLHPTRLVHHFVVRKIAERQKHELRAMTLDERFEPRFAHDGDVAVVTPAGELVRKLSIADERNLFCSEAAHVKLRMIAEERQEVVEVASCRTHDDAVETFH